MKVNDWLRLLKETVRDWYESNTFQLGAALAYYSVFALAPTLVIAVGIAGLIFGRDAAQGNLADQLKQTMGPAVAEAIQETLSSAHQAATAGWWATLLSIGVLLFAALGVFMQLQYCLNVIWRVKPKPGRGLWGVVRDRLVSFVMVLIVGLLLLASLAASTALEVIGRLVPTAEIPGGYYLGVAVHWVVTLGLMTLLFALLYKVLPDVNLRWRDVTVGAAVTAVLFAAGNYLIGLYLGTSGTTSAYGAAGSLVLLLLWVYYSSQVFLLGAEFTRVYAIRRGRLPGPADNAERVAG
jgi:membrane protein